MEGRRGGIGTVRHLEIVSPDQNFRDLEWPRNPRGNYFSKATYRGAHEEVIGQKIRSRGLIMVGREQRGPRAPYPPPLPSLFLSFSHSSLHRVQKQQRAPYATAGILYQSSFSPLSLVRSRLLLITFSRRGTRNERVVDDHRD